MKEEPNRSPGVDPEPLGAVDHQGPAAETPAVSSTVGTGSYIALSCSVMALLVTCLILGILFLLRWV